MHANVWGFLALIVALPRVLRSKGIGTARVLFGEDGGAPDGSWVSVIALNGGVALVWATALVSEPMTVKFLTILGYVLIAIAWIPFLRRTWTAFIAQPERAA